jgi:hypothetical protein
VCEREREREKERERESKRDRDRDKERTENSDGAQPDVSEQRLRRVMNEERDRT